MSSPNSTPFQWSAIPCRAGRSLTENEVHWPTNLASTVQGITAAAIDSFYREGPGGVHYQNIVGPYTQIGCGVYVDVNGIPIFESSVIEESDR